MCDVGTMQKMQGKIRLISMNFFCSLGGLAFNSVSQHNSPKICNALISYRREL